MDMLDLTDMPEVRKRRLYNDDMPDGYMESDNDFIENNYRAVMWLLGKVVVDPGAVPSARAQNNEEN